MTDYKKEMKLCLKLAGKATGKTSPNPMVGCVVLSADGNIVSDGYHKKYGEFHAERDALSKIPVNAGHTLVVNLEPCCHHGKTPPCTDIIIEKGIKRVVYGMKDPNPIVAGKGIKILRQSGVEVIGPVLEAECKELNEIFIKNKTQNLPFVALKTATTLDGRIATFCGDSKWITSDKARHEGKKLRKYYDAILTSSSTILADNPEMKHSNKIILDRELKTDLNSKIYEQGNIFVFCAVNPNVQKSNVKFIKTPACDDKLDIEFILNKLYQMGIMSVFIEAGGVLSGSMLPYVDKLYHFIAPKILSDNSAKACFSGNSADKISDCFNFSLRKTKLYSPDILNIYSKFL